MHLQPPQLKNQSGDTPARWPTGRPLHSVRGSTNAFTLVELIAVIAIVGILMALLLPVVSEAMRSGKAAKARNEVKSIKTAIDAYIGEYGKMPAPQNANDQDYSGAGSEGIIKALIGKDPALNPRKIAFLELPTEDVNGVFLDPWDNQYKIRLDNNYDGTIAINPNGTGSVSNKVKAVAWSMGLDGVDDGDDIFSLDL